MTSLREIENHLNIEIGDRKLNAGRSEWFPEKNRYYAYEEYYIVELTQDKWMIVSNSLEVRKLLRDYTWCVNGRYAKTNLCDRTVKSFHQLYFNYGAGLVVDHINRCAYDNRFSNLRVVTQQQNLRNRAMQSNNTSGYTGIDECEINGYAYFRTCIHDNNNKRLQKLFSISKLGREHALAFARAHRKLWTDQFGYDHN